MIRLSLKRLFVIGWKPSQLCVLQLQKFVSITFSKGVIIKYFVLIITLLVSDSGFSAMRRLLRRAAQTASLSSGKRAYTQRAPRFSERTHESDIKVVTASDTHDLQGNPGYNTLLNLPKGDLFIHAGDFTNYGTKAEVLRFLKFLEEVKEKYGYKYIAFVAGNRETILDKELDAFRDLRGMEEALEVRQMLPRLREKGIFYLEDESVTLFEDLEIYGSPWTLGAFGNRAFSCTEETLAEKFGKISKTANIVVTHCPPKGYGDLGEVIVETSEGSLDYKVLKHLGSKSLWDIIEEINPWMQVFGHEHEGYGVIEGGFEKTVYVNAAIATTRYEPHNEAQCFYVPRKNQKAF